MFWENWAYKVISTYKKTVSNTVQIKDLEEMDGSILSFCME